MSQIIVDKHPQTGGVPRGILVGAALLVAFTLTAAGASRYSRIGVQQMPAAKPVATLSLRFEDRDDGGVAVRNAADDRQIYLVEPGTNGFIRASLRGLVRERKRSGIDDHVPFSLTRWSDGELSLDDSSTGRGIRLDAFGETNAQAFAHLFTAGEATP
jgi:putative photosynthetic complex assembly protein